MSFAKRINPFTTVRMRLTFISAVALMASAGITFAVLDTWLKDVLATRLDASLASEWAEFKEIHSDGGMEALQKELQFEQHIIGADGGFMRVYSDRGAGLESGDLTRWGTAAKPVHTVEALAGGRPIFDDATSDVNGVRVRLLHGLIEPGTAVLMAYSKRANDELLQDFRRGFLFAFTAILLPVLLFAWLFARHAMRGVEAVTKTAAQIVSGRTNDRVDVAGHGREIEELAATFNTMLDHLFKVVRELKEINDNIAHDLRTPLTRFRSTAERLATAVDSSPEVKQIAADLMAETGDLLNIVNTMLDISEMEAGVKRLNLQSIDISELIREACDLYAPAAEDSGAQIEVLTNEIIRVQGDRQLLRRTVCNVLDNAIKYSPDSGTIRVRTQISGNMGEVSIEDSGVGILEKDLPHVFERFYRTDQARSLRGNGLGLGLVKAVALAHGGEVKIASESGNGTTVRIRLPISIPPQILEPAVLKKKLAEAKSSANAKF